MAGIGGPLWPNSGTANAAMPWIRSCLNPLSCRPNLESDLGPQLDFARSPGELCFVEETVTDGADVRVGGAQRIVDLVDKRPVRRSGLEYVRLCQRVVPVVEDIVCRHAQDQVDPF